MSKKPVDKKTEKKINKKAVKQKRLLDEVDKVATENGMTRTGSRVWTFILGKDE